MSKTPALNPSPFKKLMIAATLALTIALTAALPGTAQAAPEIGKPAPAFTGTDSHGTTHTLDQYKGKIVVLEWHNDGCPYVEKYYGTGAMQALQKTYTADGVIWLTVNSGAVGAQGYNDAAGTNALIARQQSAETARILDTDGVIGKAYGAKTTPHMFIIDKDGTLVYNGAIDDRPSADKKTLDGAQNYVVQALAELKAGRPVRESLTQPYGCGVKYKEG